MSASSLLPRAASCGTGRDVEAGKLTLGQSAELAQISPASPAVVRACVNVRAVSSRGAGGPGLRPPPRSRHRS